jgi:hypothetical protein
MTIIPESPYRSLHRPAQGDLTAINRRRVSRLRRLVNGVGLFLAVCVGMVIVLFGAAVESFYRRTRDVSPADAPPAEPEPRILRPAVRVFIVPAPKETPR